MGQRRRASSFAAAAAFAAAGVAGVTAVATPTVGSLPYTQYIFPSGAGTGALPGGTGAPVNTGALSYTALQYLSATQCQYIENSFEDDFTVSLNLSRWLPTGSALASAFPSVNQNTGRGVVGSSNGLLNYGTQNFGVSLDHCPSAGSVGANPSTCTALDPNALSFGADMPGYSATTGAADKGLIMTLSQEKCFSADGSNNAQCCNTQSVVVSKSPLVTQQISVCAAWSGAHLSSQGCVHYGTTEVEAAFDMPQESGGIQFFGKCVLFLLCCLVSDVQSHLAPVTDFSLNIQLYFRRPEPRRQQRHRRRR
jgi:hypothetical protein